MEVYMKRGIDYIGVSVGAFILNDKGEVLLCKRSQNAGNERGCWEAPGGAVEFGEKRQDAIIREIKEELGIDIEIIEPLVTADHIIPADKQHWVPTTYVCRIKEGYRLDRLPKPLSIITSLDVAAYKKRTYATATVELSEIVTDDGYIHQGMYAAPQRIGKTAILWIHGLSSTFYSNVPLQDALIHACAALGIGYASFNTRGNNVVTGVKIADNTSMRGYRYGNGGAAYEKFEDCVHDISAGLEFLRSKGYSKIIIAGHSTGANKASYFGSTAPFSSLVKGIALLSPISDRLSIKASFWVLPTMRFLSSIGFGNILMSGVSFLMMTPNRILSLISAGSAEDQFTYGGPEPILEGYSNIRYPVCVVFGQRDEHADRPITDICSTFNAHSPHTKNCKSIMITGADHAFTSHEEELASHLVSWAVSVANL
jgi:mutator protein MutT